MIGKLIDKLISEKFGPEKRGYAADELGISRAYMSDICNDKRDLSVEVAVKLSAMFGGKIGRELMHKQLDLYLDQGEREAKEARRK